MFIFIVVILFLIVLTFYFKAVAPFVKRRKYIKMEMKRSNGEKYYYWKRELRKLYISRIPFMNKFLR